MAVHYFPKDRVWYKTPDGFASRPATEADKVRRSLVMTAITPTWDDAEKDYAMEKLHEMVWPCDEYWHRLGVAAVNLPENKQ